MTCPRCAASLNRLGGLDVQLFTQRPTLLRGAAGRHAPVLAIAYACPTCEFVGTREDVIKEIRNAAA